MEGQEIEAMIDKGLRVGFIKPTMNPEYLGWILLTKLTPNRRLLEVLTAEEAPELVAEEHRREREPYFLLVIELRRDVHEAGDYETEADYRQKDKYWYASLDDVAKKLAEWGFELEDARGSRELDAP
jgi:hypothetical protein